MTKKLPDVADDDLLRALEGRGWTSAESVQRSFRKDAYGLDAPSVTLVARRLVRLAGEGRCRLARQGAANVYRSLER